MDLQSLNSDFCYRVTNLECFYNSPYCGGNGFVLLCVSGECLMNVGMQEVPVREGTEVTLLPGMAFCIMKASGNFSVRMFSFARDIYNEVSFRFTPSFALHMRCNCAYTHRKGDMYHINSHVFMDMANLIYHDSHNRYGKVMRRNFVQNYLMYLFDKCEHHFEKHIKAYTHKQELFFRFLALLDVHYKNEHTVDFYAKELSITPRYLALLTGEYSSYKSPKALIDNRLIMEIKALLKFTQMDIQAIADRLAFPDVSYLGRFFRRHTGMSITEYKNKMLTVGI